MWPLKLWKRKKTFKIKLCFQIIHVQCTRKWHIKWVFFLSWQIFFTFCQSKKFKWVYVHCTIPTVFHVQHNFSLKVVFTFYSCVPILNVFLFSLRLIFLKISFIIHELFWPVLADILHISVISQHFLDPHSPAAGPSAGNTQ